MYVYEINIDSLFLISFVMNLYFYTLAAKTLRRTATRIKVSCTSFAGAVLFCLLLLTPEIPAFIKRFIGPLAINIIMTAVIFKTNQIKEILRYTGYMFVYAFLFGGLMKYLFSSVSFLHSRQESIWCILGIGLLGYEAASWRIAQVKKKKANHIYAVKILGYGDEVTVSALSDTGNSLKEPVSGKPVSIIEEGVLERLDGIRIPEKFKLIPYHSVGKEYGMLEGYEIPEIVVEGDKGNIRWQKVIVGISKNKISANGKYQMILHPDLCNEAPGEAVPHLLIRRLGGK